jgi:NAD(P)-dependent dehydrogenase (short-subunit alcohol dehydrogenase family)
MIRSIEVNLAGRVALVTGANTGIGREIARDLARLNARVILACRSEERGRAAVDEIVADTGNHKTELRVVDLSSRASVAAFGAEMRARESELHVLVNNAGAWFDDQRTSADGIELTWATNQLGYFGLTRELLPLLEAGGRPELHARIVNVASELARSLDLGDVQFQRRPYDGMTAYAQSKQANRMWTWALARRLLGRRVTANAMHPGWVATELTTREKCVKGAVASMGAKIFGRGPAEGADTASWLAAATELEGVTGRFWVDRHERECRFRGDQEEEALWGLCERMTAGVQSTSSTTLPKPSLLAT